MVRPELVLVPLHATPGDQPPALTAERLLTAWSPDPWILVPLLLTAALYVWGVATLHRRGDRWPVGRSAAFLLGGLGSVAIATVSALGTYDTVLISVHMVQHMVLAMAAPLFLALGAPVTLALRTLPLRPRSVLLTVLHSRVAKVLTFAPLTLAIFVANPFALYFSGLYPITLADPFWHNALHLHFLVTGAMFMWPLVGIDPVPGRVSYPLRVVMLFVTLPFHAFLGISIMSSPALIAEDWYLAFERAWAPSPVDDQYLAGGILWGSGDIVALVLIITLFVQWARDSIREGAREDRRLDRIEARERLAAASTGTPSSSPAARYDADGQPADDLSPAAGPAGTERDAR